MRISSDISALWRTRWYEYLLRFLLGGVVTVLAGLIADRFGPGIGGLFLAFPAIFRASATLISSHEEKKKARAGLAGHERGRQLAAADALGAAMGAFGLIAFAAVALCLLPHHAAFFAIACATTAWISMSLVFWLAREHRLRPHAQLSNTQPPGGHHSNSCSPR